MAQKNEDNVQDAVTEADIEASNAQEHANGIIKTGVYASVGVGLIPAPVVDAVALTGIQLKMIHSLSKVYGVEFSESRGKSIIGALISGFSPLAIFTPAASLIKAIPVVGSITGMFTMSILGGASTYAIGKVFNKHFASGGTLMNLDASAVKDEFKQHFEEGKAVAKEAKASSTAKSA